MQSTLSKLSNIERAEMLKNIVVSAVTGGGYDDSSDYAAIRMMFMRDQTILEKLPNFIKTCRNLSEVWGVIKPKFDKYSERREFIRNEFHPLLTMLESEAGVPSDSSISVTVQAVSSEYIQEVWKKALERRATDPEAAITTARTLLESVCKHILDKTGASYDNAADLPKLYSLTAKQINLSPSQHTEQIFKQTLGGCQTVIEGIGALRNHHGDAHGSGAARIRPSSRHAELAVNLAGTMATFLLQTLEARKA
ncbi:MAG: abortive infection family protein [Verrucomicrobiae bacterium]|nr:abortive infection family protein [Verrucomicrobiae bacterium]